MNASHILTKSDLESNNFKKRFMVLSESNPNLYQYLSGASEETSFPGIREDVFVFICDHYADFPDDHEYAYNISQFACNSQMDPSWYEWLNSKYQEISEKMPIIDFCLIISKAVENDVSLSVFKKLYDKHNSDPLYIFEDLDHYTGEGQTEDNIIKNDTDKEEKADSSEAAGEEQVQSGDMDSYQAVPEDIAPGKKELPDELSEIPSYNKEPEYAEMFNNLLTIMTDKHSDERFDIQGKVQSHISELSVLFSSIFRMWDSDKDEMERLEALYKLQQKALYSQQKKINEMRNTITRLQYQLDKADKMDMKREEIKKKIFEMQSLMSSADMEQIGIGES